MKRIASMILILVMLVTCLPMQVWADETESTELLLSAETESEELPDSEISVNSGPCGPNATWQLSDDGVLTISGSGAIDDYGPVLIAAPWVEHGGLYSITSAVIQDGITRIGDFTFYCHRNLTTVIIPASVISIGDYIFDGSANLQTVYFCGDAPAIDCSIFGWQSATVYYPEGNTTWTDDFMASCGDNLTWVPYVPEGSEEEPADSGSCGPNVTWQLSRDGVLTISGSGPMDDYSVLLGFFAEWGEFNPDIKSIVIEDGVTTIGDAAFHGLQYMIQVQIPDSVTRIGDYAFEFSGIQSLDIPETVTEIGRGAFSYCSRLQDINIPDGITEIEAFTFNECGSLTSITIPASVSRIEAYAFHMCFELSEVYFEGDAPEFTVLTEDDYTFHAFGTSATAYYPAGNSTWTQEVMQAAGPRLTWIPYIPENTDLPIPASGSCGRNVTWEITGDGVLTISGSGKMDFSAAVNRTMGAPWLAYAGKINAVIIAQGVTSIADNAFAGCSQMETVQIADTVVSIGSRAFANCKKLTEVVIPRSVKFMGDAVFYGCVNLRKITFCGDLPELGENCFGGESLTVFYPEVIPTWTPDALDHLRNYAELVPYQFAAGDINNDLTVNDSDVAYLLWHTLFPEDFPIVISGDLDGNGFVNDDDVAYLLWHTLFPDDFPL